MPHALTILTIPNYPNYRTNIVHRLLICWAVLWSLSLSLCLHLDANRIYQELPTGYSGSLRESVALVDGSAIKIFVTPFCKSHLWSGYVTNWLCVSLSLCVFVCVRVHFYVCIIFCFLFSAFLTTISSQTFNGSFQTSPPPPVPHKQFPSFFYGQLSYESQQ